jgi:hypothetical protein
MVGAFPAEQPSAGTEHEMNGRLVSVADEVRLEMPAVPEYVHLARMTIARLAGGNSFSYEEVEDLRIAVDELCHLLVSPDGTAGDILLTFRIQPGAIAVEGRGSGSGAPSELSPFSRQLLAVVVDSYDVKREPNAISFEFVRRSRDE